MEYFTAALTGLAVAFSLATPVKTQVKTYEFDANEIVFIQSINEYLAQDGATLRIELDDYRSTIEMGYGSCDFLDEGYSVIDLLNTYKEFTVDKSHGDRQLQFNLESITLGVLGASINQFCPHHANKLPEINHWIDTQPNNAYI